MESNLYDLLSIEGLKIYQDKDHLAFSIDSILLADFAKINTRWSQIIDFGTGFAPIPLFLSRKTTANIIGIDIQEDALTLARESVKYNHLENQISLYNVNLKEAYKVFTPSSFHMVIMNPPFFKTKDSKVMNQKESFTYARHEYELTFEDIVLSAKRLLSTGGSFTFIHRVERFEEIILILNKHGFHIKRVRFVYSLPKKEAMMVLIDARQNSSIGSMKMLEPLYIYNDDHQYTEEILKIFRFEER